MDSRTALKRMWQETAPATYMKDFNKKECCDAIEKDLEILFILKNQLELRIKKVGNDYKIDGYVCIISPDAETEKDLLKLKEWFENERQ